MENKKLPCNTCEPLEVVTPQCKKYCEIELPAECVLIDVEENDCIEKEEGQTEMTLQEFANKVSCQATPCELSGNITTDGEGNYRAVPSGAETPVTYVWSVPSDNTLTGTADGDLYTISNGQAGTTLLKVEMTDAKGCKATLYYLATV